MQPIIDPDLVAARRARALRRGAEGADFLMQRLAGELADRLAAVTRRFPDAATLFSTTADAAGTLLRSGKVDRVVRLDTQTVLGAPCAGESVAALAETVPLAPASLDLAVSLLGLQDMNDLPGFLVQLRRALRPDGLFLAAMAGAGTLSELRASLLQAETELHGGASPRVHPFADVRDAGALLQRAGFALPVTDFDAVTVRYQSLFELMRDLRDMGATSALVDRARRPATRRLFQRAAEIYAERFSDPDGRVRATFVIVWMSGWAPAASQPKPAARGSATVSLAQSLGRAAEE